jgi:cyanophycinase
MQGSALPRQGSPRSGRWRPTPLRGAAAQGRGWALASMLAFAASFVGSCVASFGWLSTAHAQGVTVAIGGALADDNEAVWGRVVELAGGQGARFVVIATASSDPAASGERIVRQLQRRGARAELLPVPAQPASAGQTSGPPSVPASSPATAPASPPPGPHPAFDAALVERVAAAQGVFFSGGAQARLMDTLQPGGTPTPLLQAVRALWQRGGVVAGTSSGAAVLGAIAFRDAPDPLGVLQAPEERLRDGIEVDRGFGLLPAGVVVDQHFVRRGRIARLLPLLAMREQPIGLGVDEDSAAVVRAGRVEALGPRGVLVLDLRQARPAPMAAAFTVSGVRLSWLTQGDRWTLADGRVEPAPERSRRLDPAAPGFRGWHQRDGGAAPFFNDILADRMIVEAMGRLVDSDEAELRGLSFRAAPVAGDARAPLGFEWRLAKGPGTLAWHGTPADRYTVQSVWLDVRPVRMAQPLYRPLDAGDRLPAEPVPIPYPPPTLPLR